MTRDLPNPETVFAQAIEIESPEDRAAFLDQACTNHPELRREVEKLVVDYFRAGRFLENPAVPILATTDEPVSERPGTVIGPYKLLQQIGEGGMGTVFMAEQTHPVQRKVALKLIKAGMDTRLVIARFDAERQALAMMDHVNIARVLDAGATESGQPYFVMELVHGVPITKYCDDNHLTPRERLELFVPVCQAIQHAHQKGIIHRDVKPSNVMITLYDGKPVPKVIDFGVAKATEQRLTERTLFTQYGTMVGTFEYMSPEQAEMSALGVDTRSDIFSLGVLLYELLTGSTPLSHKRVKEAAYAEILRMIKEEEPPKPSTRLSDSGEALASISAHRHTEPAKLTKLVRGELDWIIMKTLEKDRNRRYETVNGFARDIQRYLADEAVEACPPSAGYKLRKFARKNKRLLATAAAFAGVLVSGAAVATWQWREAKANYDEAQTHLTSANEARDHERQMTDSATRSAVSYFNLVMNLSRALKSAGRPKEAATACRESMAIAEKLEAEFPFEPERRLLLAQGCGDLAKFLKEIGETQEAEQIGRRAMAMAQKLAADFPNVPAYRQQQVVIQWELLNVLASGRPGEITKASPEEIEFYLRLADELMQETPDSPQLSAVCIRLGSLLGNAKRPKEAEKLFRRALAIREKRFAQSPEDMDARRGLAHSHRWMIFVLQEGGRLEEAERHARAAIKLLEALIYERGDFENVGYLADTYSLLSRLLTAGNRPREVLDVCRQAVRYFENLAQKFPTKLKPEDAAFWSNRGGFYAELGQWKEAAADFAKAVELKKDDPLHWYREALARLRLRDVAGYRKLCADMLEQFGPPAKTDSAPWAVWTCVLAADAVAEWKVPLQLAEKAVADNPKNYHGLHYHGAALYRAGRYQEALKRLTEAEAAHQPEDKKLTATAYNWLFLAMAHHHLGHVEEATKWHAKAVREIEQEMQKEPKEPAAANPIPWNRRLTLQLLRREAEELLGIKEKKS